MAKKKKPPHVRTLAVPAAPGAGSRRPAQAPDPKFRPELFVALTEYLARDARVAPCKMFGFPSFAVGKKLFASVYGPGISLKLPAELVAERVGRDNCHPFRPYGMSVMRQWLALVIDPCDLPRFHDLIETSIAFVSLGGERTSPRTTQRRSVAPKSKARRPKAKAKRSSRAKKTAPQRRLS